MTRRLLAAALALLVVGAPAAQTEEVHTFQVLDGQVYLDGALLADAVPEGLDLEGLSTDPLEYSGPITPVLDVDGVAYVLEDGRLVRLEDSSRPGRSVYFLGGPMPAPEDVAELPEDRVKPIVEAAYMRGVAARDEALVDRMQQELTMEDEVVRRAAAVRILPDGPDRDRAVEALRVLLSDLLTLKEENRADELDVAAEQLEAARRRLAARRAHHEDIVDSRLRELIEE